MFVVLSALVGACLGAASYSEISVFVSNGEYKVMSGLQNGADVKATFNDSGEVTGWGVLEIMTTNANSDVTDNQRAFAAGVAEGYLTSKRIYQMFYNTLPYFGYNESGPPENLQNFMTEQSAYAAKMISANADDPFWQYAEITIQQLEGLAYGYNMTAENQSVPTYNTLWPFQFLNLAGDLLDLESALNPSKRLDYHDMDPDEYLEAVLRRGRCSALIKISPLIDDMWMGHSSWFIYNSMNRIYKHYIFNFEKIEVATRHMAFSSYPGYLESLDDFYMMDSGLVMLQTTNGVPNTTLYELVTSDSLYAWQRVRIANALSKTGNDWYKYVGTANSGTYNNQYMVINLNLFETQKPLKDNTLWVIEQIPGTVYGQDMTDVLERGYWASYNVPALELIYNLSGYPDMVKKVGVSASYDLAPRARIFRRDANSVTDLESYKMLLRYNNYQKDPIENDDPMWAICSRGDLTKVDAGPFGCYDTKAVNLTMARNMQATTINGPTDVDLPPFSWSQFPTEHHIGMVDTYNFDFIWQESKLAKM